MAGEETARPNRRSPGSPWRSGSLLLAVLLTAAVLEGGAAVLAQAPPACLDVDPANVAPAVAAFPLVVVGRIELVNAGGLAAIVPEAYLKGPASGQRIALRPSPAEGACALARLEADQRVLVFLEVREGRAGWPSAGQVFWLRDGMAQRGGATAGASVAESELLARIRGVTGQYAVPAAPGGEGASIDWVKTVLPVGLGLAVVLAISLVLMRVWHRIDPS